MNWITVAALLQATVFDVGKDIVTAVTTLAMPIVLVIAARWQTKQAEKVAQGVAKTAIEAAEKVATTVTDVAAKADEKVERIHVLVNSQKTELELTIQSQGKEIIAQGKEIKRLLAAAKPKPKRRRTYKPSPKRRR